MNLEHDVGYYLLKNFVGVSLEDYNIDLPTYFQNPTVGAVNEDVDLKFEDAKKLNSKEYLVTVSLETEVEIDFYIDKIYYGDYVEDVTISINNADWNRHVMLASTFMNIPITLSMIVNTDLEVQSIEVKKINENYVQHRL